MSELLEEDAGAGVVLLEESDLEDESDFEEESPFDEESVFEDPSDFEPEELSLLDPSFLFFDSLLGLFDPPLA